MLYTFNNICNIEISLFYFKLCVLYLNINIHGIIAASNAARKIHPVSVIKIQRLIPDQFHHLITCDLHQRKRLNGYRQIK